MTQNSLSQDEKRTSSSASVVLAWLVVTLPAAWGVYNTILRAANLFTK